MDTSKSSSRAIVGRRLGSLDHLVADEPLDEDTWFTRQKPIVRAAIQAACVLGFGAVLSFLQIAEHGPDSFPVWYYAAFLALSVLSALHEYTAAPVQSPYGGRDRGARTAIFRAAINAAPIVLLTLISYSLDGSQITILAGSVVAVAALIASYARDRGTPIGNDIWVILGPIIFAFVLLTTKTVFTPDALRHASTGRTQVILIQEKPVDHR